MLVAAVLGLLTGRQSNFVSKVSQIFIREETLKDESSSDNQENEFDWKNDKMKYIRLMSRSKNKVDQRLLNMFKIRKSAQIGIKMGFQVPTKSKI